MSPRAFHGAVFVCWLLVFGCAGRAAQKPAMAQPASERSDCEHGVATFYADQFAGRRTADGERYHPNELTAAHRTLPLGSEVTVTYRARSVTVRINDRGPYGGNGTIDLSHRAAEILGIVEIGRASVTICRR